MQCRTLGTTCAHRTGSCAHFKSWRIFHTDYRRPYHDETAPVWRPPSQPGGHVWRAEHRVAHAATPPSMAEPSAHLADALLVQVGQPPHPRRGLPIPAWTIMTTHEHQKIHYMYVAKKPSSS
jgi:hypothetical protein